MKKGGKKAAAGKREGSPDKSSSRASGDQGEESKRDVIWDEELERLQIKPEMLRSLREDVTRSAEPPMEKARQKQTFVVKKRKPQTSKSDSFQDVAMLYSLSRGLAQSGPGEKRTSPQPPADGPNLKTGPRRKVAVLKPAPETAPLQSYSEFPGPRFDDIGNVIPHSVLGRIEDFVCMAKSENLFTQLDGPQATKQPVEVSAKALHRAGSSRTDSARVYGMTTEDSRALRNWQVKMMERKKQQGFISKLLDRSPDKLVMNRGDGFRQKAEVKDVVDRTIHTRDYGKGYRQGAEFWYQGEEIGGEMGIRVAAGQRDRGFPPPVEQIGVSAAIQREKGVSGPPRPGSAGFKPWQDSEFLGQRLQELRTPINELVEHNPNFGDLAVIGRNRPVSAWGDKTAEIPDLDEKDEIDMGRSDPFSEIPDVFTPYIMGPSLVVQGEVAGWTGSPDEFSGEVQLEARVLFETTASRRCVTHLELNNNGCTTIRYRWRKLPRPNPFGIIMPKDLKMQRFYFDADTSIILPGETRNIPIVFKSEQPGIFTDYWSLETEPRLCGGGVLLVTLRGVALRVDKNEATRHQLEEVLAHRQAEQMARALLEELCAGVRTPERARSPMNTYDTEKERFAAVNADCRFTYDRVVMETLHRCWMLRFLPYHDEDKKPERDGKESKAEKNAPPPPTHPPLEHTLLVQLPPPQLPELHVIRELAERTDADIPEWDLSLDTLRDELLAIDEEEDWKQDVLLNVMNRCVGELTIKQFDEHVSPKYTILYTMLCSLIDNIVDTSTATRAYLGLPEKDQHIKTDKLDTSRTEASKSSKDVSHKEDRASSKSKRGETESRNSGKKSAKGSGKATPVSADPITQMIWNPHRLSQMSATETVQKKYIDKLLSLTYDYLREIIECSGEMFSALSKDTDAGKVHCMQLLSVKSCGEANLPCVDPFSFLGQKIRATSVSFKM